MLPGKVVRVAWAFLNDCFFSSLCIAVQPEELACACLCISISQQQQQHLDTASIKKIDEAGENSSKSDCNASSSSSGGSNISNSSIRNSSIGNSRGSTSLANDRILQDVQNNYDGRWAKECPWRLFGVKDEGVIRSIGAILEIQHT